MLPIVKAALLLLALGMPPSRAAPVEPQQTFNLQLKDPLSNVTLKFDDLSTSSNGLANISAANTTYQHLKFSNFTLVHTPKAWEHGVLAYPHELACASSAPNAVFSDNFATYNESDSENILKSHIYLNSSLAKTPGAPVALNLLALSMAPLGFVPAYPEIVQTNIKMYFIDDVDRQYPEPEELRYWMGIGWEKGAHESIPFRFRDFAGPEFGAGINYVEMYSEHFLVTDSRGPLVKIGDWGLCFDDLVVEWVYL